MTVQPGLCWAWSEPELLFFSHAQAHIEVVVNDKAERRELQFEPRREKTGLRGFRPGPTQTDLYKHGKELEA